MVKKKYKFKDFDDEDFKKSKLYKKDKGKRKLSTRDYLRELEEELEAK